MYNKILETGIMQVCVVYRVTVAISQPSLLVALIVHTYSLASQILCVGFTLQLKLVSFEFSLDGLDANAHTHTYTQQQGTRTYI